MANRFYDRHKDDPDYKSKRSLYASNRNREIKSKDSKEFTANPNRRLALLALLLERVEKRKKCVREKNHRRWIKIKADESRRKMAYAKTSKTGAHYRNKYKSEIREEWDRRITDPKFRMALLVCALQRNASLKRPFNSRSDQEVATLRAAKRRREEPLFRLAHDLRNVVRTALRSSKKDSCDKIVPRLGCTSKEFVTHIESQWTEQMSWPNYGNGKDLWSIDHQRPLASFNLADPEQQKVALHFQNLKPVWHTENIKKNSTWNGRRWFYSDHRKEPVNV